MTSYLEVLRQPGVARLVASQLVARFPAGMLSLAILMHVEQQTGSYGAAGLVIAAMAIGQSIAGPVSSRLLARFGMRPLLGATTLVCALALVGLAFLAASQPLAMACAAIAGLAMPPITPAVRTIYPKVVNAQRVSLLFSVDATLQELIWVIGPLAATTIAFLGSTTLGVIVCAVVLVLGGAWFWSAREVGMVRIPVSKRRLGAVLRNPVVLLMTALGALMVGVYGGIETAVVATFGHDRAETGVIIGLSAVGSLIGGFAFGHRPVRASALVLRLLPILVGAAMCCLWQEPWWLAIAFFISGIGCAPVISGSFAAVSSSVKFSQTAEAYGWMGTGQLVGGAAASALAGSAIDAIGPIGGFLVGTGSATLALLLVLAAWRLVPDLRGRDATPRPDTTPIDVVG
ncbi:hypothetical protein USB125703_00234 [Pseudoclavibacter triregionum]|nr:hypothetical protein USB125703_00234 [Pseudoclavibacter triregionum]